MRILIAEDDPVSRVLLQAALTHAGHVAVAVADGEEAWLLLQRESFSVLITDYLMPRLDGFTLIRRLRALPLEPYLYIILVTTIGGKTSLLSAIEAGADDFIAKPFDPDLLEARLHVAARIVGLRQHMHRLEDMLRICAWCKKMPDEQGVWLPMESILARRPGLQLLHSICPECAGKSAAPLIS